MSNLVERLRTRAAWWDRLLTFIIDARDKAHGTPRFAEFNSVAHGVRGRDPVEEDAADEITRLTAENLKMEDACNRSGAEMLELGMKNQALTARVAELEGENKNLKLMVDVLRKALKEDTNG